MNKKMENLRKQIFKDIEMYYSLKKMENVKLNCGKKRITYAKAVFDDKEVISMLDSIFNEWLGLGPKARKFSTNISDFIGASKTLLVNSGSSANLLALAALKSKNISASLKSGDEIITPAVTFPTTISAIIHNGFIPNIVDVDRETYNIDIGKLTEAISHKTKAIFIPHTLGNPNEMDAIMELVNDHDLFLIEDNCDALGSEYGGKKTGSFGILSTCSFYPAHHITMGEGGAISVINDDLQLYRTLLSLRDWGRDCWCESDEKSAWGACGRRFEWKIGDTAYDHKYIYTNIGYNLKPTEIQAAMGLEQFKRIEIFNEKRRKNFQFLKNHLRKYEEYLSFIRHPKKGNPAWFSFPMTVNDNSKFKRSDIIKFLESNGIQTRLVFAGDITQQPAFKSIYMKKASSLKNSETIMKNSFFIGVHPGLQKDELKYAVSIFDKFFEEFR